MNSSNKQIYRVADVEVDTWRGCLSRNGQESYLREQSLQVFLYLVENRVRPVTKEELIENVWQGMAVTDDALVQCIVEIRKALGDDSHHPHFIKTVPKVGYRFIGPVEEPRLTQVTTIKREEVTAVQVEYEEDTDGDAATRRHGDTAIETLISRVPVSPCPRVPVSVFFPASPCPRVSVSFSLSLCCWSRRLAFPSTFVKGY